MYRRSSSDSSMSPFLSSSVSTSSDWSSISYNQQMPLMTSIYDSWKVFNNDPFDSLLSPLQSFNSSSESSSIDIPQPKPYSPVRRNYFTDLWFDNEFEEITASILEEHEERHKELQLEFEMNGKTTELDEIFSPRVSSTSTPMTIRKSLSSQQDELLDGVSKLMKSLEPSQSKKNNYQQKKKVKPNKKSMEDHCVFCKNNGMDESKYLTHTVKDRNGRVSCPKLRLYKCPICGEKGDNSHTVKYCPKKPIITLEDLERMENQPKGKHRRRT